jgi:hypothetical protein
MLFIVLLLSIIHKSQDNFGKNGKNILGSVKDGKLFEFPRYPEVCLRFFRDIRGGLGQAFTARCSLVRAGSEITVSALLG